MLAREEFKKCKYISWENLISYLVLDQVEGIVADVDDKSSDFAQISLKTNNNSSAETEKSLIRFDIVSNFFASTLGNRRSQGGGQGPRPPSPQLKCYQ